MLFCFQNQNTPVGFMHSKLLFKAKLANKVISYIANTNHILTSVASLYIYCKSLYIHSNLDLCDVLVDRITELLCKYIMDFKV